MKNISQYVANLSKDAFKKRGIQNVRIITDWQKIVGSHYAKLTAPTKIMEVNNPPQSILVVKAHPHIATEFSFSQAQIIDQINTYFGFNKISKIKIIQDENIDANNADEKTMHHSKNINEDVALTGDNNIDDITDNDIKEVLYRIKHNLSKYTGNKDE